MKSFPCVFFWQFSNAEFKDFLSWETHKKNSSKDSVLKPLQQVVLIKGLLFPKHRLLCIGLCLL